MISSVGSRYDHLAGHPLALAPVDAGITECDDCGHLLAMHLGPRCFEPVEPARNCQQVRGPCSVPLAESPADVYLAFEIARVP
jgi:hypothetical protein